MKKLLILSLTFLLFIGVFSQALKNGSSMKSYEQEWTQIQKLEKDDLPKSASNVVDEILKQAIADKNTAQVIKALIYKNKYQIAVDNQQNTHLFTDLENLITTSANASDKALLHSMLAELYLNYYDSDSWTIDNRTNITGFVPDDMKEWSKNIFVDKALHNLVESVKAESELLKQTTKTYKDIIELGDDSRQLYPTLYDFLMNRAIEQSSRITSSRNQASEFQKSLANKKYKISDLAVQAPDFVKLDFSGDDNLITLHYYKEFLQSLLSRNMNESLVLTELQKNNYLLSRSELYRTKYAYDFLLSLEKINQQNEYNVEIISALVDLLNRNSYNWNYRQIGQQENPDLKKVYEWCLYGLEKYPDYKRINVLKSKLATLQQPYASVEGLAVYHPDNKNKTFKLKYRNLKEMTIQVRDIKTNAIVKTEKIALHPKTTYLTEEQDFTLDIDNPGNYKVITDFDKKKANGTNDNWFSFTISPIADFSRQAGDGQYEFYIVDRITGKPIKDASVIIYGATWSPEKHTKLDEVKTNAQGFATYDMQKLQETAKNKDNYRYVYRVGKNGVELPQYQYINNYSVYVPSFNNNVISIFTDRSIYRPGQTVYFKAISAKQVDKNTTILNTNKLYDVKLYNANNQLVAEKRLATNEFGSIAGEFILPQTGLSGQYRIEVGDNSQYFNVEEYKRPTFQVTFDPIDKTYAFGDVVTLKGRAENYSGAKVQGADVVYNVTKNSFFRWWSPAPTENIDNGTVTTNDDGSFEITFTAPLNDAPAVLFGNNIYNFSVDARVTDSNGETQNGNFNFVIGDVSMILSANIPTQLDKASKDKIRVTATNLNGQTVEAKGTYTIYSVLPNDSIKAEILSGTFTTDTVFDLKKEIEKLPSAKYLLSLNAKDDKGRDVVARNYFILYSLDDKTPPIETNEWLIEKQTTFNSAKDAEIILGVSAKNATVLFDLLQGEKLLQRQQIELSNENKKFVIPYKPEYGDQVTAAFTYVIDEKPYVKQVALTKEEEAKNLNLKFEVFRDKLRPGQQEEWRISVKDNQNKPAFAELLASMYDSSLDQLSGQNLWYFNPKYHEYIYPRPFSQGSAFGLSQSASSFTSANYNYDPFKWDRLDWFGFNFYGRIAGLMLGGVSSARYETNAIRDISVDELADAGSGNQLSKSSISFTAPIIMEDKEVVALDAAQISEPSPQIRSNFNETAFFYPQLKTDKNGETIISFLVPESNTTWKFRALAYDKSLNIGNLDALVVSRKELVVTPNMPRFLREGDITSISTKISNLSDNAISGKARIEFFNPVTDEVSKTALADFTLAKDASESVTWTFEVPSGIDMLGCRIIAESESFSDGEQHVLSVLPNRMLVTESMTMNVNGTQTKDFVFDKFVNNKSKTLSNYRLTLEYTGNPAWYAVQALPVLSNPTNENAVNWFASYYVNTLGAFIMKQYPKVTTMIEAWKKQGGTRETLVSKLQKNEELKTILLEETPWVLDAKDETEQMNRLALLFDLNNTNMQTQQAIAKLQDLQNPDGGWSWYKGMYSSRSMTQYILYGFSELVNLNAVEYPQEVRVMQMNALKYIDNQIVKDFKDLKKYNKDWAKITGISTNQLEYLYVRSNYRDIPIDQAAREAERFYTSVVDKNWTNLNLYERSLFAIIALRNGNKVISDKIMNSIREHATINDEMGMFWANNTSYAFMSNSAVTVHTFIMEAFKETKASSADMDLMKQWLLKQKQTQVWESTHATIDAIYALLSTGSNWFASTGESKIFVDNEIVEVENKELGTGYIKESWSEGQITNQLGNVKIEKTGDGPAWGAMYWQYYEDLDKITKQKGELNIDKKLFVEKITDKGKTLVEITESNPLQIGDRVIMRLTVRVDRDMEFVQLKDMRASCFEPIETLSGLKWQNNTYYYQATKDASTNFFFDHLAKGTYVFEYPVYVNRSGEYSNGISSIQCMYAPEFISNTDGIKVVVE